VSDEVLVEKLVGAMGEASRRMRYCASGRLPAIDPGIEIEGFGRLSVPLKQGYAKRLAETCRPAPYGKGVQTLVDPKVRKTLEIDAARIQLSDVWNAAIEETLPSIAEQLGLPADGLEARLYKLLVYERGGFFKPHRDSEKDARMVASLIVALPNRFEGGALCVRHGDDSRKVKFEEAAKKESPCYAAFYADCQHEVERVSAGVRLCLAYNVVLKPQRGKKAAGKAPAPPAEEIAESIAAWTAGQPRQPLVFALDHHYTQHGLSLDLLKGADRELADLVVAAADLSDCSVHLAQVTRHLQQFADDGSFGEEVRYGSRRRTRPLEIGETYEDKLCGVEWVDVKGKKQPWGEMPLDPSSIVSVIPLDDWKPTREEFEGYTGNAGNTLDRWYHRSAIAVWRREEHFDVVAGCGAALSVPLFCSMADKLAKTPKSRFEAAREDCIRFAKAIASRRPGRGERSWATLEVNFEPYLPFAQRLGALHDREAIAVFLSSLATKLPSLPLESLVLEACREFGWTAFREELIGLVAVADRPELRRSEGIAQRDVELLAAICRDESDDDDKRGVANELCDSVLKRFCEIPDRGMHYRSAGNGSSREKSLLDLLQSLTALGREDDLAKVIQLVRSSPNVFRRDECQIPTLAKIVSWLRKREATCPPVEEWLAGVRSELESAVAKPPQPPADWTRPATVACTCRYCRQLHEFLADPSKEVGKIAAPEAYRCHLEENIRNSQSDVKASLEKKGSLLRARRRALRDRATAAWPALPCRNSPVLTLRAVATTLPASTQAISPQALTSESP
jgi:hypothetical protein